MASLRAVIVDDEPKSREVLRELLALCCPEVELVGEAAGIADGVELIDRVQPALVFFDILLQEGDSFEIIDKLQFVDFEMIFVTAYDQDSVRALRFSGVPVLLKPIQIPDLITAVNGVSRGTQGSLLRYQMADGILRSAFRKIPVITPAGLQFRDVVQVQMAKDLEAGCVIHFSDGSESRSDRSVRELMQFMDPAVFELNAEGVMVRRSGGSA